MLNRRVIIQIYAQADTPYQLKEKLLSIDSNEGFRIKFNIQKDLTSEGNRASIQVYNLSNATQKVFAKPNNWLKIYAGYASPHLLYSGEIQTASTIKEKADIVTDLFVSTEWDLDQKIYVGDLFPFLNLQSLLSDVLKKAKIPFRKENIIVNGRGSERGFCEISSVKSILDDLAQWYDFSWSLQDFGFIALSDDKAFPSIQDITSLLVNSSFTPKPDDRISMGYDITCLLNANFLVGQQVNFNSSLNGRNSFKIYKIEHTGDTNDNTWISRLSGYALASLKPKPKENDIFYYPEK